MAVAKKNKDPMADDAKPEDQNEKRSAPSGEAAAAARPKASGGSDHGFFAIYKSGQGYWTRMLTAGSVVLLLGLLCQWFYQQIVGRYDQLSAAPWAWMGWAYFVDPVRPDVWQMRAIVKLGICAIIFLSIALWIWKYFNSPRVVDFMVETEKEMAKVNWTTRRELIGSTRVVIAFMFLLALVLFGYDLMFGYFFKLIGILKVGPLG